MLPGALNQEPPEHPNALSTGPFNNASASPIPVKLHCQVMSTLQCISTMHAAPLSENVGSKGQDKYKLHYTFTAPKVLTWTTSPKGGKD